MPIKPENKARYPKDWKQISARIKEREGHKCKFCGLPNYKIIMRIGDCVISISDAELVEAFDIAQRTQVQYRKVLQDMGYVRIVLTVAHLDHQPENNADENLAALCQRCHNRYDMPHRIANRKITNERKKATV
jgi:5-methylcytosine-specific restriction endonuclease McrA